MTGIHELPGTEPFTSGFQYSIEAGLKVTPDFTTGEEYNRPAIRVTATSDDGNASLAVEATRAIGLTGRTESLVQANITGRDISWKNFFAATKDFVGDLSSVRTPSAWDRRFEFEFVRGPYGGIYYDIGDAEYLDLYPPFDDSLASIAFESPYVDAEKTPYAHIISGWDFSHEFILMREKDKMPEVRMSVAIDDFIDPEEMYGKVGNYINALSPGVPAREVLQTIQTNPLYAVINPIRSLPALSS